MKSFYEKMSQSKQSQLDSMFESSEDYTIPETSQEKETKQQTKQETKLETNNSNKKNEDSSEDSHYSLSFEPINKSPVQSIQCSPLISPSPSSPSISPVQLEETVKNIIDESQDEPTDDSVSTAKEDSEESFDSDEEVIEHPKEYNDCLSSIHTENVSPEQSTYHIQVKFYF